MPPKSKINKQDILTSSLEIIRKSDFEEVMQEVCKRNELFYKSYF